ncbi:MAG: PrsW family intramembrane metalloprotease, partial [Pseudomonadota bacterium]|nr:PrsW family intramembrane metalloprotease [Pseudomonadota bacterium]
MTPAAAALLALLLWRGGLRGRLFLDALAIGATLGAAVAVALTPFELRVNPLRFSPQTLAFLFAGLPEEGVKMIGVAAFLRPHYLARDRRDVVYAAGALSLGFAALENLFYLANAGSGWAALAVVRALTAMPFHVCEGLAGGYVVASAAANGRGVVAAVAGWLGLAAIHGVYDFAVFAGAPGAVAPAALQHVVAALGLDLATTLRALLAGAQSAAAL